MSQTTGNKFPNINGQGGGSGVAWANPIRVRADDGSNATCTTVAVTNTTTQYIYGAQFVLLEEDGGPIPAGATIIKVTFEIEWSCAVTDSIIANVATVHMAAHSPGGTEITTSDVTVNDNTTNAMSTKSWTTGGTQAVPQTAWTRAMLGFANGMNVGLQMSLPAAATNTLTGAIDSIRVNVEWIKYIDGPGGAKVAVTGGTTAKAQVTKAAVGGKATATAGGSPKPVVTRGVAGGKATATAGALAKPAVNVAGGAKASVTAGDAASTILAKLIGGAKALATAGGVARVFSYAISGITRTRSSGAILPDARVDVFRTALLADGSDVEFMARVQSDPTTAVYAVPVPLTGNETATFWARAYKAGAPNTIATSDEDLTLIETQIQGPP